VNVINRLFAFCSLLALACVPLAGQTFDLNGPANQGKANQANKSKSKNARQNSAATTTSSGGI
jgi:hypothetical protein